MEFANYAQDFVRGADSWRLRYLCRHGGHGIKGAIAGQKQDYPCLVTEKWELFPAKTIGLHGACKHFLSSSNDMRNQEWYFVGLFSHMRFQL